jgi:hypothetical protein
MISYTDFDFAIARWKARVGGAPQPAHEPPSGAVQSEVPVATAPEAPSEPESGAVAAEAPVTNSGLVMSESLLETPTPESQDPDQK